VTKGISKNLIIWTGRKIYDFPTGHFYRPRKRTRIGGPQENDLKGNSPSRLILRNVEEERRRSGAKVPGFHYCF
jgi:hypothetical protein